MLLKLCPDQIKESWDLINRTIDETFPKTALKTKNSLLKDLLLEVAQCWFYFNDDNEICLVFLTKLTDDYVVGRKTFTLISMLSLKHVTDEMIAESFITGSKFAKDNDCDFMDFYSNDQRVLDMTKNLNILWKSSYVQIEL